MGNDMSWEQKCRISALRAACASVYDFDGQEVITYTPEQAHVDDQMTTRILRRAETFRVALLSDGALDYVPDDDTPESTPTTLGGAFRTPISTHCPGCGSSRQDTPLMIEGGLGCEHKWHQL